MSMKSILLPVLIFFSFNIYSQTFLRETFEGGEMPSGWFMEYEKDMEDWEFRSGGNLFNPDSAAEGTYNAYFQVSSTNNERTKLISPPLQLANAVLPRLTFWHVMDIWWFSGIDYHDELRVYYKTDIQDNWKLIKDYTNPEEVWVEQVIYLDTLDLSDTYYLAFEGKSGYGHGVCIDDIRIEEAGYKDREVSSFTTDQASTAFIATGSENNKILQNTINVTGNQNLFYLETATFKSLNTSDADILPNGVKLYYTEERQFTTDSLLATGTFTNGEIVFENLNFNLEYGNYYFWLTYDIIPNASHGHTFDAYVPANGFTFSQGTYPESDQSPEGSRTIFQTLYYDDFETDNGWILNGFEIAEPTGLGGNEGGNPDPSFALSGTKILGTNVTAAINEDANYAPNLTDREVYAISPPINCDYFISSTLRYERWLNLDIWDNSYIEVSNDGMSTWHTVWSAGDSYYYESDWAIKSVNISQYADRNEEVYIKISLGTTDDEINWSGWNIDNMVITANFIDYDVAVTELLAPVSRCGHTDQEDVTVRVVNLAGAPTPDTIPIAFSFDNGLTFTVDTIFGSIALEGDTVFTFHRKADLTESGYVTPIVKTMLDGDEFPGNDSYTAPQIFLVPTRTIPYATSFETDDHYWTTFGNDSSTWELNRPNISGLNYARSGSKTWVTNDIGDYNLNDSSYILSTCFDFAGIEYPVFEFYSAYRVDPADGGFSLQYSTNRGDTWQTVPVEDNIWNWYNQSNITALTTKFSDGRGWAGDNLNWTIAKQQLPINVAGATDIRFRIVFATNEIGNKNFGVAIDDVKIYEMPSDIGITQITSPISACEISKNANVTVELQNFGLDAIESGTVFYVSLKYEGTLHVTDTVTLSSNLAPGATLNHTFSKTVDVFSAGSYELFAQVKLPGDVNFLTNGMSNDTASKTVVVYGMPEYDLGADFGTERPDTVVLNASGGYPLLPDLSYEWDSAYTGLYRNLFVEGKYFVTVTNDSACVANDSIEVFFSAKDIQVAEILNLDSACTLSSTENIELKLKNISYDRDIETSDVVYIKYTINGVISGVDTLELAVPLAFGDSLNYILTPKADLSEIGVYDIEAYVVFNQDIDFSNDTAKLTIMNFGYPDVNLGIDTIFTTQADTVVLIAQDGFDTYNWSTGSTNDTLFVSKITSETYNVTVTDIWGCGSDEDSVVIIANDLQLSQLLTATDYCDPVLDRPVRIQIRNIGNDTIMPGTSINAWYNFNEEGQKSKLIVLADSLKTDSTLIVHFDDSISLPNYSSYSFEAGFFLQNEMNAQNNIIVDELNVYGYPEFSFGFDTILTSSPDTLQFNATTVGATYLWNDGRTQPIYNVSSRTTKQYIVTVSVNGCGTSDTIQVIARDLTIVGTNLPSTSCNLTDSEIVTVDVKNNCDDIITAGTNISLSLTIDGSTYTENVPVPSTMFFGQTRTLTFAHTFDFSAVKMYNVSAKINGTDVKPADNSTSFTVRTRTRPEPAFAFDTIVTGRPDTVEIWMRQEYDSYLWQDGSTSDVYYVTNPDPQWYKVTVSQIGGCEGSDSVFVKTYDFTLTDYEYPLDACEHSAETPIRVRLTNSSLYTVKAGEKVPIGYSVRSQVGYDTITLPFNLASGQSSYFTLSNTIDASDVGIFDMRIWCNYYLDSKDFNDTISYEFSTYGLPDALDYEDTILTLQPDTLVLQTRENYPVIEWKDGTTLPSFGITNLTSQTYWVQVTDNLGCTNRDSVTIISKDIEIIGATGLSSNCTLSESQGMSVRIANRSNETIQQSTVLRFKLTFNGVKFYDSAVLTSNLPPNDTVLIPLTSELDLTSRVVNNITIVAKYPEDANYHNDSLVLVTEAYGYPEFNLNYDTLFSAVLDTVRLYADGEFDSYLWSTGSTNDTLYVSDNGSALYFLTVTDIHGCSSIDSAQLINNDISISQIISPVSNCALSETESISFEIQNTGYDVFSKDSTMAAILYHNGSVIETKIVTFINDLSSGESIQVAFDTLMDFSAVGTENLSIAIELSNDADLSNNTMPFSISNYGYPDFSLGNSSVETLEADSIVYELATGLSIVSWNGSTNGDSLLIPSQSSEKYIAIVENVFGCRATDSIEIIAQDLQVDSLIMSISSCSSVENQLISASVTNTGKDMMAPGDSIFVRSSVGSNVEIDTIVLTAIFAPGESINIITSNTLSVAEGSSTTVTVEVINEKDIIASNNSASETVEVFNSIQLDLNISELNTKQPDTVTLSVIQDFASYEWSSGATSKSFLIGSTGEYGVTVTDENGCQSMRSATIKSLFVSLDSITNPVNSADLTNSESLTMHIENAGTETIPSGSKIYLLTNCNGTLHRDTVQITSSISTAIDFTSKYGYDLSAEGNHSFSISGNLEVNGEIMSSFTYGFTVRKGSYPSVELEEGRDTVFTSVPYVITLDNAYDYLWHNGSTDATYTVDRTGWVYVTISNNEGYSVKDSVFFNAFDLQLVDALSPISHCDDSEQDSVSVTLFNNSPDTVFAGKRLSLIYEILGNSFGNISLVLANDFLPQTTMNINFANRFSLPLDVKHEVGVYLINSRDINPFNDTLRYSFTIHNVPNFSLFGSMTQVELEKFASIIGPEDFETYTWSTGSHQKDIQVVEPGDYSLTVTDENGCTASASVNVIISVGITNATLNSFIYPNIVENGMFTISSNYFHKMAEVDVVDASGKVLYTESNIVLGENVQVNLPQIASGYYTLLLKVDGSIIEHKFVVR